MSAGSSRSIAPLSEGNRSSTIRKNFLAANVRKFFCVFNLPYFYLDSMTAGMVFLEGWVGRSKVREKKALLPTLNFKERRKNLDIEEYVHVADATPLNLLLGMIFSEEVITGNDEIWSYLTTRKEENPDGRTEEETTDQH